MKDTIKQDIQQIAISITTILIAFCIMIMAFFAGYGWEAYNADNKRMQELDSIKVESTIILDTNKTDTL